MRQKIQKKVYRSVGKSQNVCPPLDKEPWYAVFKRVSVHSQHLEIYCFGKWNQAIWKTTLNQIPRSYCIQTNQKNQNKTREGVGKTISLKKLSKHNSA